jgi:hypothetical protein
LTLLTLLTSVVTFLPSMSMLSMLPSTSQTTSGLTSSAQSAKRELLDEDLYSEASDVSDTEETPQHTAPRIRTGRSYIVQASSRPLSRTNSPPRSRVKMEEPCCKGLMDCAGQMTSQTCSTPSGHTAPSSLPPTSVALPTHQTVSQGLQLHQQLHQGATVSGMTTASQPATALQHQPSTSQIANAVTSQPQLSALMTALSTGAFHQVIEYVVKNNLVPPALLEQCKQAGVCHNPAMLASLGSSMVPCC